MTIKLNPATITVDGKTYDAVADVNGDCDDCATEHNQMLCLKMPICSTDRPDGKSVIWIERKDPEAPAFDMDRLLTDDEKRDDELTLLRAEVTRLQAVNRIAIRHLDKMVNAPSSLITNEARDWLALIGGAA